MKTLLPRPLALVFLCSALLSGCQKETPDTDKEPPLTFTFDQQQYSSGQLVVLQANRSVERETYTGSFGDSTISLARAEDDSALVFMAPFIADGQYTVKISGLSPDHALETEIVNLQVSDPQAVLTHFGNNTSNHIGQLETALQNGEEINHQDIQALRDMKSGVDNLISQLSATEKQQLAVFIKANGLDNISLNPLAVPDSFMVKSSGEYPSIQWSKMGAKLIVNGTAAITTGYVFANLVAFPDPTLVTKAAAGVAGVALCAQFIAILSDMKKMARFTGIPQQVNGWFTKSQPVLYLNPNTPQLIGMSIDYRVLTQADANSPFGTIKGVAVLINRINNRWISFKNQVEQIKSWFVGSSPKLHSSIIEVSQSAKSQTLRANPGFFKIENISNNVALSHSINPDGIELEVTTTTETSFSFDVVYENPDMGNPIRKTISAEVQPSCGSTFTDPRDGKVYDIVEIGNQCWMAENLSYSMPNSKYYQGVPYNLVTYGRLYTANDAKAACPPGWHLPSAKEWRTMVQYLGGSGVAGGKMKSTSSLWDSPNTGATNSSGFSALPGGRFSDNTGYGHMGTSGYFWSSTDTLWTDFTGTTYSVLALFKLSSANSSASQGAGRVSGLLQYYSCRCVKDQ